MAQPTDNDDFGHGELEEAQEHDECAVDFFCLRLILILRMSSAVQSSHETRPRKGKLCSSTAGILYETCLQGQPFLSMNAAPLRANFAAALQPAVV